MHTQDFINPKSSESMLKDERRKNWFWDYNEVFDSDLSNYAKLVRLYLARCADSNRVSWPSYNRISKACGISRRTAQKAIDELEEKGWVKKNKRRKNTNENDSNIYVLCDPPKSDISEKNNCKNGGGVPDTPPCNKITRGSAPDTPPCNKITRGSAPDTPPCNEITGGGVSDAPPCNEITRGGGVPGTLGGAPDAPGGAPGAPKQYPDNNKDNTLFISNNINNRELAFQALSPAVGTTHDKKIADHKIFDSHPQAGEANAAANIAQKEIKNDQLINMPTAKELIAELVRDYRSLDDIKQRKGDYAFIGCLYNKHGYNAVYEAINKLSMSIAVQDIKDPLLYLKGILEPRVKNSDMKGQTKVIKNEAKKKSKKELIKSLYMS
ncbi:helix-turn-helix domain-containing protein [Desulfotruncus arcticus]|nr:helix-turn-helix domain-containing protein [Desulfotruncus arcticus]